MPVALETVFIIVITRTIDAEMIAMTDDTMSTASSGV